MAAFTVETLSLAQTRALYHERMTRDFPPDELKPLAMIERALARDEYISYGAVSGGDIWAYAYFVKLKEQGKPYALFDYFAVRQDLRDQGVGSGFLQALISGPLLRLLNTPESILGWCIQYLNIIFSLSVNLFISSN